jgi:hypothetical protein
MSPSDAFETAKDREVRAERHGDRLAVARLDRQGLLAGAFDGASNADGVCAAAVVTSAARRQAISTATRSMMGSFQTGVA